MEEKYYYFVKISWTFCILWALSLFIYYLLLVVMRFLCFLVFSWSYKHLSKCLWSPGDNNFLYSVFVLILRFLKKKSFILPILPTTFIFQLICLCMSIKSESIGIDIGYVVQNVSVRVATRSIYKFSGSKTSKTETASSNVIFIDHTNCTSILYNSKFLNEPQ